MDLKLVHYQCVYGIGLSSTTTVRLECDGTEFEDTAIGSNAVVAAFGATARVVDCCSQGTMNVPTIITAWNLTGIFPHPQTGREHYRVNLSGQWQNYQVDANAEGTTEIEAGINAYLEIVRSLNQA